MPFAVEYVFQDASKNKDTTPKINYKKTGRQIAKEFPGYFQNNDDLRDTDAKEEVAALQEDLKSEGKDIKSINLCKRLGEHLGASKDTIQIDEGKGGGWQGNQGKAHVKNNSYWHP